MSQPQNIEVTKDTRTHLLECSKGVFAAKGLNGATVKDLAEAAGVNVSLISYYFKGKEGLYRACIESVGQDRLAMAERILKEPHSVDEFRVRLQLYVEELIRFHIEDPDVSLILLKECTSSDSIVSDLFKTVFFAAFLKLATFFESAQQHALLSRELDAHLSAFTLFGAVMNTLRMDSMRQELGGRSLKDSQHREIFVKNTLHIFLSGVLSAHGH